uniref:Uncharacterized protein n=1 Tax=Solanum tuberosum TaxID=4113 RepID=M0ZKJ1_SOLTU
MQEQLNTGNAELDINNKTLEQEDQAKHESDDNDDEEEEISNHLIKAFGSTFQSEYQDEVQEVTGKQGLSPKGRKETRQTIKSNSISATTSRTNTRDKSRGIDSILPYPEPLDNVVEEAVGGMAGMIQETPTNVQERVPKERGELPHVVHEDVVDISSDYRGLNTPISTHKITGQQDKGPHTEDQDVNKDRHGRPPQDDYEALNSEDELDSDNQSIDESGEEEEDNNNQPPHTFGSTLKDKWPEEVHEPTAKQGLSPRGRKQSRQTKQQTTSTSANSGRPITRSKSKGF